MQLINGFVYLLLPVQVLATAALPRFGYKRQMIFGWGVRAVFLTVPFALALLAPTQPTPWMVNALVASLFCFTFARSIGSCAAMPWQIALFPDRVRGRYYSGEQLINGVAGVGTLLFCSALFWLYPEKPYTAFAWQFGFSLVGSCFAVWCLTRIDAVENPHETSVRAVVAATPGYCARPGGFRQYLFYMLAYNVAATAFTPFLAYYLKFEEHLPQQQILLYSVFQYLGAILGAYYLRRRVDRFGPAPIFRSSLLLSLLQVSFWGLLVYGIPGLRPWIPLAYFVFGLSSSNWTLAHLKYLPRVCPAADSALAISIHGAVIGVWAGVSSIIWGALLRDGSGSGAGMNHTGFLLYLVVFNLIQLGLLLYLPRLLALQHDDPPQTDSVLRPDLLNPGRWLGRLINLVRPQSTPPSGEERR